jgi:hypothetical protein
MGALTINLEGLILMTNKQIAGALVLLIAVVFGVYALRNLGSRVDNSSNNENSSSSTDQTASGTPSTTAATPGTTGGTPKPVPQGMEVNGTPTLANLTYDIEGTKIILVEGTGMVGARKTLLSDYGAWGDLNGNGTPDAAVVLVDQPGGTGMFYYVVGVVDQNNVRKATNAILLGDRIKLQSVAVANNVITVKLLDRKAGDPMTAEPTVAKTLTFHFANGFLIPGAAQ